MEQVYFLFEVLLKDRSDVWLDFKSWPDCSDVVAEQRFVVWLKIMVFVTQNDATEVGNNFPHSKNVLESMVSNLFM